MYVSLYAFVSHTVNHKSQIAQRCIFAFMHLVSSSTDVFHEKQLSEDRLILLSYKNGTDTCEIQYNDSRAVYAVYAVYALIHTRN